MLKYYMDEHLPGPITRGLSQRGIDVFTVQEDNRETIPDPAVLDRAMELGRVVVTCDPDFLIEAVRRQREKISFAGLAWINQHRISIGRCIDELELIASVYEPEDLIDDIQHLPL